MPERTLPVEDVDEEEQLTTQIPSSEIPVEEKSSTGVAQAEEMVKAVDQQQPLPTVLPAGGIADRVLLGKTKDGREIFWEFGHPKLNNRHFLIFGNSGWVNLCNPSYPLRAWA